MARIKCTICGKRDAGIKCGNCYAYFVCGDCWKNLAGKGSWTDPPCPKCGKKKWKGIK